VNPEISWRNLKKVLFALVDKHIPTITEEYLLCPFFDCECDCHAAYRRKERAHKKFKLHNSLANEPKHDHARCEFKSPYDFRMRNNLYNSDDPALITKKFWSHVKSKTKSGPLPECMHLNGTFRNLPSNKAELFSSHSYNQFSEASSYDIDVDWRNDQDFDTESSESRISNLLALIDPSKAPGPDGIHGKILKNCSNGLALPLSLIFKVSCNSASIPRVWKIANVVPVYKKGSKDYIENYRLISLTSLTMKTFERILNEELQARTSNQLDERQYGFLTKKSCTTNMVTFTDSVVLSVNDTRTLSTDVVYFDFSNTHV
jgi:hypothetical protein